MKRYLALVSLVLTTNLALADEPQVAPKEVYDEIMATCNEWAQEDGTSAEKLQAYLAACVEDELANAGYLPPAKS